MQKQIWPHFRFFFLDRITIGERISCITLSCCPFQEGGYFSFQRAAFKRNAGVGEIFLPQESAVYCCCFLVFKPFPTGDSISFPWRHFGEKHTISRFPFLFFPLRRVSSAFLTFQDIPDKKELHSEERVPSKETEIVSICFVSGGSSINPKDHMKSSSLASTTLFSYCHH